jgi:hypothetical protein
MAQEPKARTQIEKLGFRDPDRREPQHDLACAYLSERAEAIGRTLPAPDGAAALERLRGNCQLIMPEGSSSWDARREAPATVVLDAGRVVLSRARASTEWPLMSGSYAIGFLDVVLQFEWDLVDAQFNVGHRVVSGTQACSTCQGSGSRSVNYPTLGPRSERCYDCKGSGQHNVWAWVLKPRRQGAPEVAASRQIIIEVKITPAGIGEILRQIGLYRQYFRGTDVAWWLVTTYPLSSSDLAVLQQANVEHRILGEEFRTWIAARPAPSPSPEL